MSFLSSLACNFNFLELSFLKVVGNIGILAVLCINNVKNVVFISFCIIKYNMEVRGNRRVIRQFFIALDKRGLSNRRKKKYLVLLRKISNIKLTKLNKRNVEKFFFYLKDSKLSDETKKDYWIMFRIFVKWIKPKIDTSDYKLKIGKTTKLPEEILTLQEVRKIVLHGKSIRDRAMISLLYDSGARPSELLNLHRKDVIFDDDGLIILFNGKTGGRRVRIITTLDSDKFLREYLLLNSDDKLFDIGIERLNQIVKEYSKEIRINKRVYTYIFRHSRATHLAKHLTEAQMKIYLGWSMGSRMVSVYVHLSGRDIDNRVLELNNNYNAFIPSESFKQFLLEQYQEWRVNNRKVGLMA